jgi:L-ascorbate metabolism protein UlaG (beta-lactamase superfamily)
MTLPIKVKKLGHCCLVIEVGGLRIMTDPGNYTTAQDDEHNIDIILITHEHTDHLHIDSLNKVLANNPSAIVYTNSTVGKLLDAATPTAIPYQIVAHGDRIEVKGKNGDVGMSRTASIEGFGKDHAPIYKTVEMVENTGYMIADRLFYPGDAFHNPGKPIDVLALPVAGPWMKISEAIDYAQIVKPKACFPVHDGNLKTFGISHRLPTMIFEKMGVKFVAMGAGDSAEF